MPIEGGRKAVESGPLEIKPGLRTSLGPLGRVRDLRHPFRFSWRPAVPAPPPVESCIGGMPLNVKSRAPGFRFVAFGMWPWLKIKLDGGVFIPREFELLGTLWWLRLNNMYRNGT